MLWLTSLHVNNTLLNENEIDFSRDGPFLIHLLWREQWNDARDRIHDKNQRLVIVKPYFRYSNKLRVPEVSIGISEWSEFSLEDQVKLLATRQLVANRKGEMNIITSSRLRLTVPVIQLLVEHLVFSARSHPTHYPYVLWSSWSICLIFGLTMLDVTGKHVTEVIKFGHLSLLVNKKKATAWAMVTATYFARLNPHRVDKECWHVRLHFILVILNRLQQIGNLPNHVKRTSLLVQISSRPASLTLRKYQPQVFLLSVHMTGICTQAIFEYSQGFPVSLNKS